MLTRTRKTDRLRAHPLYAAITQDSLTIDPVEGLPRFTYMGAGAKHRLRSEWCREMSSAKKYIDLTAGSCNQPFWLGRSLQIPVVTNDASYYSYCIARGLGRQNTIDANPSVLEGLLWAADNPRRGLYWERQEGNLPGDLYRFIDAWIYWVRSHVREGAKELMLACTGSAMLSLLTFRGCGPIGLRDMANGQTASVAVVAREIFRSIARRSHLLLRKWEAFNMDARGFVKSFDGFEDATVSFDPAWPYADNSFNPYSTYHRLGEYLKQEETPAYLWSDDVEEVLGDVVEWIGTCLQKGAERVMVWNQSTNKPSQQELRKRLRKHFHVRLALEVLQNKRRSAVVGEPEQFVDYVFECKP